MTKYDPTPKLLVLDVKESKIQLFDIDGSGPIAILEGCGGTPDGIAIDPAHRHIYWTNMGEHWDRNDGFIERINFDGSGRTTIIPGGATFTPKQMVLDLDRQLMYWADREGMKLQRANLDGSDITTLLISGKGPSDQSDERNHCVGISLDKKRNHLYWTQKGAPNSGEGRIFRAGLDIPAGADPANRPDIEVLLKDLPEPIDLEISPETDELYWTDRGDPPKGNTLNKVGLNDITPDTARILTAGLQEAIGLALDIENNRAYVADLAGNIYSSDMEGNNHKRIFAGEEGRHIFTGVALVKNWT